MSFNCGVLGTGILSIVDVDIIYLSNLYLGFKKVKLRKIAVVFSCSDD
jgi:hypothetical protein